ncbi:MAG: hemerythrin family protein [Oscillospiraceae bacterium]
MAYTWNKNLETGNATIDSQHKELINAINQLLSACAVGEGRVQIKDTSRFLLDYTKRHFADEEKLQVKSKYPDYSNHKKYHSEFVKVVNDIVNQLEKDGPTIVMVGKINNAIAGWLISHISTEDVKVAAHIKSTLS